jgi:two-component system chemotaxis response regulator CheY
MSYLNPKLRVLVVDDFPEMRKSLQMMLMALSIDSVLCADGGIEAIRMMEAGHVFDLIISDLNMPQMSGMELLKHVRNSNKLAHLPFLMITAEATKPNVVKAAKAGVTDFIVKPFSVHQLTTKIAGLQLQVRQLP